MSNVGGAASRPVVTPMTSRSSTFDFEGDRYMHRRKGERWKARERNWAPRPDDALNHPNRTLVLCFDGTGDQFDDDNSNVVQLVTMLKKDDPAYQMVYYQTGIGTYTSPSIPGLGMRTVMKVLDQMLAWNLESHVLQGYEFLMQNYTEGDKICLFGFSRGAYTARALAGMLQKVGLVSPCNFQQLPFAWALYEKDDEDTMKLAREFKQSFCIDVSIEFLGVWDTVASVGIFPKYLPFVGNNSAIRYFRHALALDERRSKFHPLFHASSLEKDDEDKDEGENDDVDPESMFGRLRRAAGSGEDPEAGKDEAAAQYEKEINAETGQKTDALEIWFAGAHTDVGGGSVRNHTRHSLARIPLRWMVRECFRCNTGIIFDMDMLQNEIGMDVDFKHRRVLEAPDRLSPTAQDTVPHFTPGEIVEHVIKAAAKEIFAVASYPIKLAWWLMGSPFRNAIIRTKNKHRHERPAPPPPPFMGEAEEELRDALSPAYDQLRLSRPWWILEWVPLQRKKQKAIYDLSEKASDYVWVINNGQGRKIFKHVVRRGIKVHRSVLTRLEALDNDGKESYAPQIRPNITVKRQDGKEVKFCRQVTNEEWRNGSVDGLDIGRPWFQWV